MTDYSRASKTELIKALRALESVRPSVDELQRVVHELQVHQVEIEIQNRELRETQQQLEESRDQYADLYDYAPLGYATLDDRGIIRKINLTGALLLGRTRAHCVGTPFSIHVDKNDRKGFRDYIRHCRRTMEATTMELTLARSGAEPIAVRLHSLPMPPKASGAISYRIAIADISLYRLAQEELRRAATVFENCGEAIVVCDDQNRIVSVNRAFSAITGYARDEIVGKNADIIGAEQGGNRFPPSQWSAFSGPGYWQGDAWGRRKNGETYPQWLTVTEVRSGRGTKCIGIFSDTTQSWTAAQRIEHLAHHDSLTDLPNRVLLKDRIAQALSAARRSQLGVAVLFVDMDLFKLVNDSLGHTTGDEILKLVAQRITQSLRTGDTVSRHGGDEFIVVLPEVRDDSDAGLAVEKILHAVSQPCAVQGHELRITASIGVSIFPRDGEDPEALIRHADIAMYHTKENGRNHFQFFTPALSAELTQRQTLESSLHRAIERNEFALHFQPQVATTDGRVVACEALIRWQHPQQGLVPPDRFIPIAEQCGLINSIGEWVLRGSCAQHREWRRQGLAAIPVAVNLSGLQLRQKTFCDMVRRVLQDFEFDPRDLELELTESTLLQDVESTTISLRQLKAMGLRIVLDDFGTGYSSLGYLKRFSIDKLKIDKSFVCDIPQSNDDATLVRTIISMGHNLGMTVIAEGVETRAQYDFLATEQCEEMQGYYFGKPLPPEEFARMLQPAPARR